MGSSNGPSGPFLRAFLAVVSALGLVVGLGVGGPAAPAGALDEAEGDHVLVVVGRGSKPASSDRALIERLEDRAITVEVIDDDDLRPSDADAAALVLVTDTAQAKRLVGDLEGTETAVASLNAGVFEVLGLVAPNGRAGGIGGTRRIVIDDPGHPLAGGLTGTVTVLERSATVSYADIGDQGTLVASRGSASTARAVVFSYEQGDLLGTGEPAPGRRIGSFMARGAVNRLTDDGWRLFDALIDYGRADIDPGENRPPTVEDQRFSVADTATPGDSIGAVAASDPDGDPLTFSLDDNSAVAVDPATGELTLVDLAPLVLGGSAGYSVTVTVADPDNLTATATIVVTVERPTGAGPMVEVIGFTDGQTVDIGATGTLPLLQGAVEEDGATVTNVVVEANGERVDAGLERRPDGTVRWSVPIGAPTSDVVDYTITAVDTAGASTTTSFSLDLVAPQPNTVVVSPFVVVLDDPDAEVLAYDPDGGVLELDGDAVDVAVGTVLVAGPVEASGSGLAVVVETVIERTDTTVVVGTRPAELEEMFLQVGGSTEFSVGGPVLAGGPFAPGSPYLSTVTTTTSLEFNKALPPLPVDEQVTLEGFGEFSVTGGLTPSLQARLQVQAEWRWLGLPDVEVVDFFVGVAGEARARVVLGVTVGSDADPLGGAPERKELFDKTLLRGGFLVGPVPIYWEVDAEMDLVYSAEIAATAGVEGEIVVPFELGAGIFDDSGRIGAIREYEILGEPATITAEGAVELDVALEPQLVVELWKTVEVAAGVEPSLKGRATVDAGTGVTCWSLDGALAPFLRADIDIPINDAELELEIFELPTLNRRLGEGGTSDICIEDRDGDGVLDVDDNCPDTPNFLQIDSDGDGIGDACEVDDRDGDGIADDTDNCVETPNTDQADRDADGVGDACDADPDDPGEDGAAGARQGGSYGHPTLITFDGLRYLFHGAGDYVLAESTTDDFAVHGRFGRAFGMTRVSFNRAIAARVGDSVIGFADGPASVFDPVVVTLDGDPIEVAADTVVDLPGGATVRVVSRCGGRCPAFQVDWPTGEQLQVGSSVGDDYILTIPPERSGNVLGLLGNADGQPANDNTARGGESVAMRDVAQLYDVFGRSWLLEPAESLLMSTADPVEVLPLFPTEQITLADLPAENVASAEAECLAAGILPGAGLDQCTFDVAITGLSAWINSALAVTSIVAESAASESVLPTIESSNRIVIGQRVDADLGAASAADDYVFSAAEGDSIVLGFLEGCDSRNLALDLYSPTGAKVVTVHAADCEAVELSPLPASGDYTARVYDTSGGTPTYGFWLRPNVALLDNPAVTPSTTGDPLFVQITDPTNGAVVPAGGLTIDGLAGLGEPAEDARVVYVIDLSSSTVSGFANNDCNGDGVVDENDNLNPGVGDRLAGTILDCELAAVMALNRSLVGTQVEVSVVVFGSDGLIVDVGPAPGIQRVTSPDADANDNGILDIEEVLGSLGINSVGPFTEDGVGSGTDFDDALLTVAEAIEDRGPEQPSFVFFLSDGADSASGLQPEIDAVVAAGGRVNSYSIGSSSAGCDAGALLLIAEETGGDCVEVDDPTQLVAVLADSIGSLEGVVVSVDGATPIEATVNAIGRWAVELPPLEAGTHIVRATATADDGTVVGAEVLVVAD